MVLRFSALARYVLKIDLFTCWFDGHSEHEAYPVIPASAATMETSWLAPALEFCTLKKATVVQEQDAICLKCMKLPAHWAWPIRSNVKVNCSLCGVVLWEEQAACLLIYWQDLAAFKINGLQLAILSLAGIEFSSDLLAVMCTPTWETQLLALICVCCCCSTASHISPTVPSFASYFAMLSTGIYYRVSARAQCT